jgi:hypothetical protein
MRLHIVNGDGRSLGRRHSSRDKEADRLDKPPLAKREPKRRYHLVQRVVDRKETGGCVSQRHWKGSKGCVGKELLISCKNYSRIKQIADMKMYCHLDKGVGFPGLLMPFYAKNSQKRLATVYIAIRLRPIPQALLLKNEGWNIPKGIRLQRASNVIFKRREAFGHPRVTFAHPLRPVDLVEPLIAPP